MIVFVVFMHLAVTYSGIGGWYIKDTQELDAICTVFFGLFQSFTQAYFMGFLFLISGYFVVKSYDKKGWKIFLLDRFIRLGIPTLIYMLIISPFINYVLLGWMWDRPTFLAYYFKYLYTFSFIESSGPLWFAFALLIFNLVYCFIRLVKINKKMKKMERTFCDRWVLIVGILIAICAFLIRLIQPIDTNILNMQLCFFAQYIILFIIGVKAGRYDWFSNISYQRGKKWLFIALIPGIIIWVVLMITGGALDGGFDLYKGGMTWQSGAYALWESFISVSMSMGLIGIFHEKYNNQTKKVKLLSDNSFSVYIFHAPIIITVSLLIYNVQMYPLLKFIVATVVSIPICFLLSHFVFRRIPFLKRVL
jgi:surface polysaccharide O-acyltransferase-like enzyme